MEAGSHLDVHRAVDGLHCLLLVAQDGVREGDGDLAVHVHALTLEVRVWGRWEGQRFIRSACCYNWEN